MNVLVLGGTRYFGVHMVQALLHGGHSVTIATRGKTKDTFGNSIKRIAVDRTSREDMAKAFEHKVFDVVCDNLAYSSNDVKYALDAINCKRYIMTSSSSVYSLHMNTSEKDFIPQKKQLVWGNRSAYPYDEGKRLAECALFQAYASQNSAAVRFPFVLGADDYTKRLYYYVEHTVKGIPMFVDNIDAQMSFVSSVEAGRFLAFLAEQDYTGAVNGSSGGTMSIREIIQYVEAKSGKKAVFSDNCEAAPYNGTVNYSINTDLASSLGFNFSLLDEWIYDLLDTYKVGIEILQKPLLK